MDIDTNDLWLFGIADKRSGYSQICAYGSRATCLSAYEPMLRGARSTGLNTDSLYLMEYPTFSVDDLEGFLRDPSTFYDFAMRTNSKRIRLDA